MAYDWCVAICHSFHYTNIMKEELYISWGAMSWILPCGSALSHTLQLARANSTFSHFFCDLTALMKLSCSDISPNELVIFTVGTAVIPLPLIFILISYGCIEITFQKFHLPKESAKLCPHVALTRLWCLCIMVQLLDFILYLHLALQVTRK